MRTEHIRLTVLGLVFFTVFTIVAYFHLLTVLATNADTTIKPEPIFVDLTELIVSPE